MATDLEKALAALNGEEIPQEQPPAAEPPATEEPPNVEEEPVTPTVNYEEVYGGRFKTADEYKSFFEKYETEKGRLAELETQVNHYKSNPIQIDPELYKLGELSKKTGIKDFATLSKVMTADLKSLDPIDVIIMKQTMDDPDLLGKEDVLRRQLTKEYGLVKPKDFDDWEEEKQAEWNLDHESNQLKLTRDVKKVRTELQSMIEDIKLPEVKTPEQLQEETQNKIKTFADTWREPLKKVFDFKSVQIEIDSPIEKDKKVVIDIDVAENSEIMKQIQTEASVFLFQNGINPDAEQIEKIKQSVTQRYIALNVNTIINEVANKVRTEKDDYWRSKTQNSSLKNKDNKTVVQKQMTDQDKTLADMNSGKY